MTQGYTKGVPIDTDPAMGLNSNQVVPSQAAVVTYVTASVLNAALPVTSTANQILLSRNSASPVWSTTTYPSTNAVSTLLYASSANVMAALPTANSATLVTGSTGVPTMSGTMTNGQTILGSTGATPVVGTIAGTANQITATVGAGSLTFSLPSAITTPGSLTTTTTLTATLGDISATVGSVYARGGGLVSATGANVGGGSNILAENTDNTNAASYAMVRSLSGGSSAGDAIFRATISGATDWVWGIDNSDADSWVLCQGNVIGTNNTMRVDTSGRINYPLQPSFSAYLQTSQANKTGAATAYTIPYDTELYDIGSNFNSTTGTFTAPVTGKYLLIAEGFFTNITAAMTQASIDIVTTANTFRIDSYKATTTAYILEKSIIASMTAGDTAIVQITIYGGAGNTASVAGKDVTGTLILASFCGQLIA